MLAIWVKNSMHPWSGKAMVIDPEPGIVSELRYFESQGSRA